MDLRPPCVQFMAKCPGLPHLKQSLCPLVGGSPPGCCGLEARGRGVRVIGCVETAGLENCRRCLLEGSHSPLFSLGSSAKFLVGLCTRNSRALHELITQSFVQLTIQ